MKKRTVRMVFAILLLAGTAASGRAEIFSRIFNADYPVYGFAQLGYSKPVTIKDLTTEANFVNGEGVAVVVQEARVEKDGNKFVIKLLLRHRLTRIAGLEIKLESDPVTRLNYITELEHHNFTAFFGETEIEWNGSEARLDEIMQKYSEFFAQFYEEELFR
ncbi:MAG: hypothetical protein LBK13_09760 [Spirochaetales bacterium]|jgi:hypothetical protein|nr:hypothetical protein [Spirochaetales bacterium]